MKHKFRLVIFSLLSSIFNGGATSASGLVIFRTTPLRNDGKITYIEVSATGTSQKPVYLSIYIINDLYTEGVEIGSYTFKTNEIQRINYDNSFTRTTNSIKITWQEKGTTTPKSTSRLIPVSKSVSTRADSELYSYKSNASVYQYTIANGWQHFTQTLTFKNFQDYYMPDYYHKVDLSVFRIEDSLSYPATLKVKSALLTVNNNNAVFDGISTEKRVVFPIKLIKKLNYYTLGFSDPLYVNPLDLTMSLEKKEGYVRTEYLYLPRNEKVNELSYAFDMVLSGVGIDYSTFVCSFRYKSVLNTFGDCRNSEYCVVNK